MNGFLPSEKCLWLSLDSAGFLLLFNFKIFLFKLQYLSYSLPLLGLIIIPCFEYGVKYVFSFSDGNNDEIPIKMNSKLEITYD